MPLTQDQRDDILEELHEFAEARGEELSAENVLEVLFDNWDDVVDLQAKDKKFKRKQLQRLKADRDVAQTSLDTLDQEIADLEAELPKGARSRRL